MGPSVPEFPSVGQDMWRLPARPVSVYNQLGDVRGKEGISKIMMLPTARPCPPSAQAPT